MSPKRINPEEIATNHQALVEFVMEKAADAPARTRVKVYRGLANVIGDQQEAANLKALSDSLEHVDYLTREFRFRIENSSQGGAK